MVLKNYSEILYLFADRGLQIGIKQEPGSYDNKSKNPYYRATLYNDKGTLLSGIGETILQALNNCLYKYENLM